MGPDKPEKFTTLHQKKEKSHSQNNLNNALYCCLLPATIDRMTNICNDRQNAG